MPTADDALLREQVRMLGKLLGDTVAELRGPAALELVERTRRAAVALREGKLPGGRDAFAASIAALGIEDLELLAKAFTDFFQLINAAEEQHRIRALRGRDTAAPIDGSIAAACAELAAGGVSAADVQALLDRLLVMPVLTAHPTEARRRTVLDHLAEVAAALDRLDDPRLGARERGRADERLAEVVSAIVSTRSAGRRARRHSTRSEAGSWCSSGRSSTSSHGSTASSPAACGTRTLAPRSASVPSSGSAPGSAATATATRLSRPR